MINTLYLPELREMLTTNDEEELREFCTALHPSRIADFMDGLSAAESWQVLRHTNADPLSDHAVRDLLHQAGTAALHALLAQRPADQGETL